MTQPNNTPDREFSKFVDSPTRADQSAVEVVNTSNRFAPDPRADYIQRVVAGSVETYNFYQGGAGGVLVKTVQVTYTNSSLNDLLNVAVTFELPL